jgi:hypothetical protein
MGRAAFGGSALRAVRRRGTLAAAALAISLLASAARGDEPGAPVETAGTLYDRGVEAQQRGDYARAAKLFARADELVPDPTALQAAIGAAVLADDPALAMELVHRARRGSMPAGLRSAARAAEAKFAGRAGVVRVRCDQCTVKIDGKPVAANEDQWVLAGSHRVDVTTGGSRDRRDVDVPGGGRVEVTGAEATVTETEAVEDFTPRARTRAAEEPGGIAPGWFWASLGLTGVMGAFAVGSGVDTLSKHSDFQAKRYGPREEAERIKADGEAAESRTAVLIGVTSALAIGTVALGVFAVRWNGGKTATVSGSPAVVPGPGGVLSPGGRVSFRARF